MQQYKIKLLRHIAFIMDGNRRWARKNKLKFSLGHRSGVDVLEKLLKVILEQGEIEEVTLYVFSSENWKRGREECDFLFSLLVEKLPKLVKTSVEDGVRINFVGDLNDGRIPRKVKDAIARAHKATDGCSKLKLNLAFNYGASIDKLHATKSIALEVASGKLDPKKITEHTIREYSLSRDVSTIDLVIRTGGEVRTSNFFEVQTRYSEWIFIETFWPDFTPEHFKGCLVEFLRRERRYGASFSLSLLKIGD